MRLCGISTRFRMLSPCTWQVTHALLTRPPLGYEKFSPQQAGSLTHHIPVRLACVKHAASVHPEPGSNSRHYFFTLGISLPLGLLSSNPVTRQPLAFLFFRLYVLNYSSQHGSENFQFPSLTFGMPMLRIVCSSASAVLRVSPRPPPAYLHFASRSHPFS